MSTSAVSSNKHRPGDDSKKRKHDGGAAAASSSSSSKHKTSDKGSLPNIWNSDASEFICQPQFHNSLPNAPCGPYFKQVDLLHPYADFATYRASSLEKNYVWQPHFPPDLGIRLNLVDQESILNPDVVKAEVGRVGPYLLPHQPHPPPPPPHTLWSVFQ